MTLQAQLESYGLKDDKSFIQVVAVGLNELNIEPNVRSNQEEHVLEVSLWGTEVYTLLMNSDLNREKEAFPLHTGPLNINNDLNEAEQHSFWQSVPSDLITSAQARCRYE